jgi:hypothetical protein
MWRCGGFGTRRTAPEPGWGGTRNVADGLIDVQSFDFGLISNSRTGMASEKNIANNRQQSPTIANNRQQSPTIANSEGKAGRACAGLARKRPVPGGLSSFILNSAFQPRTDADKCR